MERRAILFLIPAMKDKCADAPPPETDPLILNSLAEAYNTYVLTLKQGVLDLKLWRKVVKEARRVFRFC